MDWTWALQLAMAVASVVVDREDDLSGENSPTSGSDGRSSHRQPRIVAVPPGAPVTIGMIFGVPISILIPVVRKRLADFGREGEQSENTLPAVEEGAGDAAAAATAEAVDAELAGGLPLPDGDADAEARGFPSSSIPAEFDNDQLHEQQLRKLDDYFGYMEITSDKCKRRIICEVAAAPEDFYPVSDIILRQVKPRGPITPSKRSRFYRFLEAAKLGFNGDIRLCAKDLGCKYSGTELFDAKMLRVLQLLGRHLNIEFVDRS